MWLIIVEAFIALGMLCFIVWWTMFHGRSQGEQLPARAAPPEALPRPLENRADATDLPDVSVAPPAPGASPTRKPD